MDKEEQHLEVDTNLTIKGPPRPFFPTITDVLMNFQQIHTVSEERVRKRPRQEGHLSSPLDTSSLDTPQQDALQRQVSLAFAHINNVKDITFHCYFDFDKAVNEILLRAMAFIRDLEHLPTREEIWADNFFRHFKVVQNRINIWQGSPYSIFKRSAPTESFYFISEEISKDVGQKLVAKLMELNGTYLDDLFK